MSGPLGERSPPKHKSTNRFISSLSYVEYRRLFLSTSFAGLANWTLLVGRGWLAFHLTGSSTWVGVVTFAGFLPFILGPFGGVLADRFERKRLAAVSTAISSALSFLLAALTLAGMIEVWQLAVVTVVMSVPRASELPSRQAMIASTVPSNELLNAVSLSSVATFGTRAIGPAIVVPLISGIGAGGVFFLAGCFYIIATLAVLRIQTPTAAIGRGTTSAAHNLIEGVMYVVRTPSIATVMVLVAFHCGLTMSFDSLLPVFAVQQLHSGGASFSAMAMGVGAGALFGSIFIAGIRSDRARGRMLLWTAFLSGLTPMAMALPMSVMNLPLAVSAMIAMGATQGAFMSMCGALVQVAAPDELRGRVSSFFLLFAGGLMAWMNLINGALADIWDAPILFLAPAVAFIVVLCLSIFLQEPLRRIFREGLAEPQPSAA